MGLSAPQSEDKEGSEDHRVCSHESLAIGLQVYFTHALIILQLLLYIKCLYA